MKVCALMSVWNSAPFLPNTLRGIYPYFDSVVVTESCWVRGYSESDSSPDGTADIIRKFIREEDTDHKVFLHQAGTVGSQPEGRNSGLYLVPKDTEYVYMVDSDETYFTQDLLTLRALFDRIEPSRFGVMQVPAKCFYFDGTYYREETFVRGYEWFPGQRFWAIASMLNPMNRPTLDLGSLRIEMMHYSYVSREWTRVKGCIGEDVSKERYETWWNEVYSQFDGDLEKLYSKNQGGPHVFGGGGPLKRYYGPHPDYVADLPIVTNKWK